MTRDTIEQFRSAIAAAGLSPPAEIIADGGLHRFASNGASSDDAGWYVLHPDGIPAGIFGCWRSGIEQTWRGDVGRKLTLDEAETLKRRADAARRERETDKKRRQADARQRAAKIWQAGQPEPAKHPYLQYKGINSYGIREHDGELLIPVRDPEGELHSLQFIGADGGKRFLVGGRVQGCYYTIGRPNGVICIAEGYATGASVHATTGHAVAVAFNAGNLEATARPLRQKYPDLRIVVCADDDFRTEGNPGLTKATEAARAVGGIVAVPDFGADRPDGATDFNDLHKHRGLDAVRGCIERAQPPSGDGARDDAEENAATLASREIERIAALPLIEYERNRTDVAKRLGVRTTALDKLTAKARENIQQKQTIEQMFGTVEPWGQPVDGQSLLTELAHLFERFVVLPKHSPTALALWVLLTYSHDAFQHSPILLARSATKRCGKSTLVSLLAELVHRPMPASNLTPAVMFRVVEQYSPTLLIDEVDSFLGVNEELRGILNSGHQRATAKVYRIEEVGGTRQTVGFSTWAPKLLAMIGRPPSTILDRSISIHMQRKLRGDKVEKRRHAALDPEGMRSRCARWAADNAMALAEARPEIPDQLNDRQADGWEPLSGDCRSCGHGMWRTSPRRCGCVVPSG